VPIPALGHIQPSVHETPGTKDKATIARSLPYKYI